jgi:hypothetical protein
VWWGCHPSTLKLFYSAYIRSQLDYAAFLIEPTSKKNLFLLDKIQYQGLRLILGAMRSSPVNALQVVAAEPPLALRRQLSADCYLFKCSHNSNHPIFSSLDIISSLIQQSFWKNKPPPPLLNSYYKVQPYLSSHTSNSLPLYSHSFHTQLIEPEIRLSLGIDEGSTANRQFILKINTDWFG